jgi:TolA-binding protein
MRGARALLVLGLVAATAGCVTRADLVHRDQQMMRFMREQRRQLDSVQREVERLRGDVEGTAPQRTSSDVGALESRVAALEVHVYQREDISILDPDGVPQPTDGAGLDTPGVAPPPTASSGLVGSWARDVAAERAAANASGASGAGEYDEIMGTLSGKDCGPAVSKLDGFAERHRTSPLADNALYWAARCYVLMGDSTPSRSTEYYNQAISKFYDVGTSYPKGEKTPAALLEQGDLFIRLGDVPDARIVFSRLIRDYPGSSEASEARQKLVTLGN